MFWLVPPYGRYLETVVLKSSVKLIIDVTQLFVKVNNKFVNNYSLETLNISCAIQLTWSEQELLESESIKRMSSW